MRLLGFRTNKTWKKVLSVLYLCFFLIVVVFFLLESKFENISTYDFIVDKMYGLYLMSMFLLPYIFLSDTKFRDKLPLFNNQKATSSVLGLVIIVTILLIFSAFINGLHSDEYKADMKDHAFKKTVATEATCETDGVIDCNCEYCGLHTTEVIESTGHKMVEISESLLKCEVCGKEETTEQQTTTTEPTTVEETTTKPNISTTETPTVAEVATSPVTEVETTVQQSSLIVMQFTSLGFTYDEAKEMEEIFATVGITEISNIQPVGNNGIDNLQAFICDIFDYSKDKGGISAHFTIDKRQLCFISLDGIPETKVDYAYINIFGNVKFKTSSGKRSVTLYDVWDENGEIIPNTVGYKAVFDYENKKITAY